MEFFAAELLAREAFGGARDRTGGLLIEHGIAVAARVAGADAKIAGVLHDVLEDTSWSAADLRAREVPDEIVAAVEIVTRRDEETYEDFVGRIASARGGRGRLAREVKVADLTENLARVHQLPPTTGSRLESRYRNALAILRPLAVAEGRDVVTPVGSSGYVTSGDDDALAAIE